MPNVLKHLRGLVTVFVLITLCSSIASASFAEDQGLPPLDPAVMAKRGEQANSEKAWSIRHDKAEAKFRRLYGTRNGLLARELMFDWSSAFYGESVRSAAAIDEWLKLYPEIPSNDQQALAGTALYNAKVFRDRKIFFDKADAIEAAVIKAAVAGHWNLTRDTYLKPLLEPLISSSSLSPDTKSSTIASFNATPDKTSKTFESALKDLEDSVDYAIERSGRRVYPVNWKEPSWLTEIEVNRDVNEDGDSVGNCVMAYIEYLLPRAYNDKYSKDLDTLISLYPKLSDLDKQFFISRTAQVSGKLLATNLTSRADSLTWLLLDSINPFWINNQGAGWLNTSFYRQTFQNEKAVKIFQKKIQVAEITDNNPAEEQNLRVVLGETYDIMGEYDKALEQFKLAEKLRQRVFEFSKMAGHQMLDDQREYLAKIFQNTHYRSQSSDILDSQNQFVAKFGKECNLPKPIAHQDFFYNYSIEEPGENISRFPKGSRSKNGLLVFSLQSEWKRQSKADTTTLDTNLKEWLHLYPTIPSDEQRLLATNALILARAFWDKRLLTNQGKQIRAAVAAAGAKAHWHLDNDLCREFQGLLSIHSLPKSVRSDAASAITTSPDETAAEVENSIKTDWH